MFLVASSFLASLVAALLVHELGHLAAALALRCDPRLLCLGIGPAVLRRRLGGVWIVLRPVPLAGYVMLPPRPAARWGASLVVTAAGPAANAAALIYLQAAGDGLPGPVRLFATCAQGLFLFASLLPLTQRIGGTRLPSDGLKILALLARPRRNSLDAIYDGAVAAMHPRGDAPAMTAAFAEIVLQGVRPDRRKPWGRRQSSAGLDAVLASPTANATERALARFFGDENRRAEEQAARRRRPDTTADRAAAAAGGKTVDVKTAGGVTAVSAEADVTHPVRAGLTGWLWLAVLVVAVVGPIYDARRRSSGEGGRLDASQLRFDLLKDRVDGRQVVALDGTIGGGAIVELREAIARYGLRPGDILLLDSPGGELNRAAVMGRIIRRHGLATRVGALRDGRIAPADCASACVALFAAGTRRVLPEGSRIGIHSFRSHDDGDRTEAEIERSAQATERREVAYFAEMGVAPELEESAAGVSPDDIRWLTPEEAIAFKLATARGDAG